MFARLKLLGRLVAIVLAVLLLSFGILKVSHNFLAQLSAIDYDWLPARFAGAMNALPGILQNGEKAVLVLGASEIQTGFVPQTFDARARELGINATSYNFGFQTIGPSKMKRLAQRIVYEAERSGHKLDTIVVEFTPSRATKKNVRLSYNSRELAKIIASVYSWPMILSGLPHEPELMIGAAFVRLVGDLGALFWAAQELEMEGVKRVRHSDPYYILWDSRAPHAGSPWDPAERGAYFFEADQHPEVRSAIAQIESSPAVRQEYITLQENCCDTINLDFDESAIATFIDVLRLLKPVTTHLFLTAEPIDPRVGRTLEVRRRLQDVLFRIHSEADVPFLKVREDLDKDDYMDLEHFTAQGREHYSRVLAERYVEALSAPNN